MTTLIPDRPYDPEAIYDQNGPLDPIVIEEAVCTLMQNTEIDLFDSQPAINRRMYAVLRDLAALHPRDEADLMICVQAVSAQHAANNCWRLGTRLRQSSVEGRRYIATAGNAARTFGTMMQLLARRQAKPLSVPVGRPASQNWGPVDLDAHRQHWQQRGGMEAYDVSELPGKCHESMNDEEVLDALAPKIRRWLVDPDEGLDIANTEGILPGGGMIMPEDPTPEQAAYLGRRLNLMYYREQQENRRTGNREPIVFRGTRPGDLIP